MDTCENNEVQQSTGEDPSYQRNGWRLTLEPELCAVFFTLSLSEGIVTILMLQQSCQVRLGYSKETCALLETQTPEGEELEVIVQTVAAKVLMWKSLLLNVLPAVAIFFVGPWSDIYGRKPLIVAGMSGCTLMYSLYLILSSIPYLDPAYLIFAILPLCLLGGYINFYSGAYCYVSEICHPDDRSYRMGLVETVVSIGGLVGVLASSRIFQLLNAYGLGFSVIFFISGVICFITLIHSVFFLRESVVLSEEKMKSSGGILVQPVEMFKTCLQPREDGGRAVILLCTSALVLMVFSFVGVLQIEFLFLRKQFNWSYNQYAAFSAFSTVVNVIGIYIGTRLLPQRFGVSDVTIVLTGSFLAFIRYVLISMAGPDQGYLIYIAIAIGFLNGANGPALRAILSRVVSPEDLGKVFSLTNSIEALSMIAAPPAFTYMYTSSLNTFPGLPFLVSALIYILVAILICIVALIRRRHQFVPLSEEVERDN